jgi:hypothetical protein
MPITLAGSARRRVVERATGAAPVAGSAHGSIARGRVVERDAEGGAAAGSAHGSIVAAGCRGCADPAGGVLGATGRGEVACGVDSAVRSAASFLVAGATGGDLMFANPAMLELFVELAPTLYVVPQLADLGVEGAFGARFYF